MKKIIYFTLFLLLIINVNALDVKIDIQKEFDIDEIVSFNYTITSNTNQQIKFIPHSKCPKAPIAFLDEKEVALIANQPYKDTYYDIKVDDSIEPQTCTAYIEVLSPVRKRVEKTFEIKTNPSFKFDILFDKKVFIRNENVNIDFESSVENPSIKATLTYPNKKIEKIDLPYSFKAEQIGTYELEVTASKEGYKTITKKEQFGVIEKEANIPYTDLSKIKVEKKEFNKLYILIGLIILLIFIIIYLRKKRK